MGRGHLYISENPALVWEGDRGELKNEVLPKWKARSPHLKNMFAYVCILDLSEQGMGSLKCDDSNATYVHGKARDKARLRTAIEGALKVRACNMLLKNASLESHNFKWFRLVFDRFGPRRFTRKRQSLKKLEMLCEPCRFTASISTSFDELIAIVFFLKHYIYISVK